MKIELELWQLVTLFVTFWGGVAGAVKWAAGQQLRHLDDRFKAQEAARNEARVALSARLEAIEAANRDEANQWQRVERELLSLKADLPVHYVRREDYIRGQSVIEAKLDGLATKFENAQLRMMLKGAVHDSN